MEKKRDVEVEREMKRWRRRRGTRRWRRRSEMMR